MIATADIAAAGVRALTDSTWTGAHTRALLGERDISYTEATTILGRALGVPDARYERAPAATMIEILTSIGFSRSYAQLYVEMTGAFNSGELTAAVPRTGENTTATSFEEYAAALTTEPS